MVASFKIKPVKNARNSRGESNYKRLRNVGGLILIFLIVGLVFMRLQQFAKIEYWVYHPVNKGVISEIAIKGYDPVSYFIQNFPIKGKEKYSVEWNGAIWLFSSIENSEIFKGDPIKYSPQYGGYCAYAVSQGYTFEINPLQWYITDNKLYLVSNITAMEKWMKNRVEFIQKANLHWEPVETGGLTMNKNGFK